MTFRDNGKRIGADKGSGDGVYTIAWKTGKLRKGVHHLTATLRDSAGHRVAAGRKFRVCK